jgi:hypothetical protein
MLADEHAPGGHHPQDTAWAADTSGFGLTQPPHAEDAGAKARPASPGWLNPVGWLRRASPR